MTNESAKVYHFVAFEFAGRDRAKQVIDLIRKENRVGDYYVAAWAVVEVDDRGKSHVKQSGHGKVGAALGGGGGILLSLIGGPAGLLAWLLGGALVGGLAGKFLGHQFDADKLKAIGAGMEPNSSALVALIEDFAVEEFIDDVGVPDAKVITMSVGSQLSGEVAQFEAVAIGDPGAAEEDSESVSEETSEQTE